MTSLKPALETPPAPTSPKHKLQFLDGLRGLAALFVVVSHARMLLWEGYQDGYLKHPQDYSLIGKMLVYFFAIFKEGHSAVLFFFILSGFVIHLNYAKKLKADPQTTFDLGSYLIRRARRIYPPMLYALLVTTALDALGKRLHFPIYSLDTPYAYLDNNLSFSHDAITLLGNLAFLMKSAVPVWGTNGPLWSLHFEWWFYMLYPIFWVFTKRSIPLATFLIVALFFLAFSPGLWHGFFLRNIFMYMLSWWFGVLLADVYQKRISISFSYLSVLSFSFLLTYVLPGSWQILIVKDTFIALSFVGVLAFCFFLQEKGKAFPFLERLKLLGDFSYTLYVTHFPIMVFLSGWLMSQNPGHILPAHFTWVFISVPITMFLAYLAHFAVEQPFTKKIPTTKQVKET